MRVMQIIDRFAPLGGTERFVYDLSRQLTEGGHTVRIAACGVEDMKSWGEYDPDSVVPGRNLEDWRYAAREFAPDVILWQGGRETLNAAFHLSQSYPMATIFHSPVCPSGARLFRDNNEICSNTFGASCMVNWYTRKCGTNKEPWRMLQGMRLTSKMIKVALNSRVIYTVSNSLKEILVRDGLPADKIQVIDNTLGAIFEPVAPIVPRGSGEALHILFCGRLVYYKGVQDMIQAIDVLNRQGINIMATIVGEGWYENKLKVLVAKLGLESKIIFAGRVPGKEVDSWYDKADAVVVPSIWPEPAGLVVPEARRRGKSVIVYDAGGLGEWKGYLDGIQVVPRGDVEALATAMAFVRNTSSSLPREGKAERLSIVQELQNVCRHA
ncbi:glycosyltransferase family 4 protein [Paenibacillus herberti]|uniref:Glycosyl transferase family 1 n=1 Tax=Paenibacillus herberti TaxID=1619309 RepID=A0A229NV59_9BACL|nr:glycosyltransferase family 4 protein [Paenibacillus herberti]OXM13720.1 hypothetical protein CGZ75_22135 [Paenibacillus herberti]